ncbi:hypothetical protein LPJ61_004908 [Coemansia biformis]|uniref:NAD(P)-binding protein n=1 Tax=Coemansia biformis TaxID=1286918 RepID=A0A9W8CWA7_9FUNG|nr:hypothetical protein LPJ61_004908 [Coemansia biformis]
MWLRDLVDRCEGMALSLHRAARLPGIMIVVMLSFWESVYCLLYRFVASERDAEGRINAIIRAHRRQCESDGDGAHEPAAGKVAIVTGANGGIGFETAKALGRAGFTTVLACRNVKRGRHALQELQEATGVDTFAVVELDLASFTSIEQFAANFIRTYGRLHVLVCNAGIAFSHYDTTYDGLESQFGTNFVGHYVLIDRLLETMKNTGQARITIASSIAACMVRGIDYTRVTDVWRFDRFINYSTSKLALLVLSAALARRLDGTKVTVNAFHPGLVVTSLYRNVLFSTLPGIDDFRRWLWLDQVSGSVTSVYLALAPELDGKTGGFYAREQPAVMHPDALSIAAQDRLLTFTDVLVSTNTHAPGVLDSINLARLPATPDAPKPAVPVLAVPMPAAS